MRKKQASEILFDQKTQLPETQDSSSESLGTVSLFNETFTAEEGLSDLRNSFLDVLSLAHLCGVDKTNWRLCHKTLYIKRREELYQWRLLTEIGPNLETLITKGKLETAEQAYIRHSKNIKDINKRLPSMIISYSKVGRIGCRELSDRIIAISDYEIYHPQLFVKKDEFSQVILTVKDLKEFINYYLGYKQSPKTRCILRITLSPAFFPHIIYSMADLAGFVELYERFPKQVVHAVELSLSSKHFSRLFQNMADLVGFVKLCKQLPKQVDHAVELSLSSQHFSRLFTNMIDFICFVKIFTTPSKHVDLACRRVLRPSYFSHFIMDSKSLIQFILGCPEHTDDALKLALSERHFLRIFKEVRDLTDCTVHLPYQCSNRIIKHALSEYFEKIIVNVKDLEIFVATHHSYAKVAIKHANNLIHFGRLFLGDADTYNGFFVKFPQYKELFINRSLMLSKYKHSLWGISDIKQSPVKKIKQFVPMWITQLKEDCAQLLKDIIERGDQIGFIGADHLKNDDDDPQFSLSRWCISNDTNPETAKKAQKIFEQWKEIWETYDVEYHCFAQLSITQR